MECPLCASRQIRTDYPPPRGYFLLLAGAAMLFVRSFLSPALMNQVLEVEGNRLLVFGLAICAYGAFCLLRHGNRYCGTCGFRFRAVAGDSAGEGLPAAGAQGRIAAAFAKVERQMERAPEGMAEFLGEEKVQENRQTLRRGAVKIEPLLACLKFKDAQQRHNAAETLREISGKDFGEDYEAWRNWHEESRKSARDADKTEG